MGRLKSRLDTLTALYRLSQQPGFPHVKTLPAAEKLGLFNFQKSAERAPKPRRIVFPEDPLIESFYAKRPEFLEEPVDLGSCDPPFAKRFALRQLELMEKGLRRSSAERRVEKELQEELRKTREKLRRAKGSVIQRVQAEEERSLMAALQDAAHATMS